ncbi:MAG: DNA alkylation repair protein [Thermodesulfobacteriota bacterium]
MARAIGKDHSLALELWDSAVREARILACLVDDPERVTRGQLEAWAAGLDSWDLTDQLCNKLVVKTSMAWELVHAWAVRPGSSCAARASR